MIFYESAIAFLILAHAALYHVPPISSAMESSDKIVSTPNVYLDIKIGEKTPKRMIIKLYDDVVPRTAANFRALCIGNRTSATNPQQRLQYKNSHFHRVIRGFMMQGGDFTRGDGTGGLSIYGAKFADENFRYKHDRRGRLSMANAGRNTNGSQFFILFSPAQHLDGKHVVFGEVISGLDILDEVEMIPTDYRDRPKTPVKIVDAGIVES